MIEKLNIMQQRFNELSDLILQPDIISDHKKYVKISREYKELKEIVDKKIEYESIKKISYSVLMSLFLRRFTGFC